MTGQEITWYALYEDGTLERFSTDAAGAEPVLSRPGRFITEAEYLERLAQMEAESAARAAELDRQAAAQRKADYDALIALGVPEETARRLSGWTGP